MDSTISFSKKMNLILFWISIPVLVLAIFRVLNQRVMVYFLNMLPKGDEGLFIDSFDFFIKTGR